MSGTSWFDMDDELVALLKEKLKGYPFGITYEDETWTDYQVSLIIKEAYLRGKEVAKKEIELANNRKRNKW